MHNTASKISIITCFYNVEDFLEQTVESVLKQTYTNWELLLIDDGSADGSTRIAKMYAQKYPQKIFYFEHESHSNKGLSYSRNKAIKIAQGNLLTFLDGDDVWLLDYLAHQAEIITRNPKCAMVCEATEYWYNWKYYDYENKIIQIGARQDSIYSPPDLILNLYPLGDGEAPCMCGIIIRKNILEKHGGFDESFRGMYEDQVFLSKIYLNENIFISSACNNRYRQRADSLLGSSFEDGDYYFIRKQFLKWLKNYIENSAINYPEVNQKLQTAIEYEPMVSVVTCFYNEERFLEEAICSVLKQRYTNWELLLVDDGSTDNSANIARKYVDKHPDKIFYCEHEGHSNKGLSASRNLGIKKAKGSLIALLDADDTWLEGKLLTQVSIFQRNPEIGMAAEASIYWSDWGEVKKSNIQVPIGVDAELVYEPFELMYHLYPLSEGAAPVPSGLMIKKETFDRSGFFEESYIKEFSLYEDQAFLAKMYLQEKVYISSACNNLYRQRPGSIVTWVREKGHYYNVRRYFLKWLQTFLLEKKIEDRQLKRLLDRALFRYNYPRIFYLVHEIPMSIWKGSKKRIPEKTKKFIKQKILRQKQGHAP